MSIKLLSGRYELIERIGDGGMAIVYKSRDRLLNRHVAIKILKPEYARDPRIIDSFRKESQAAAGLSHPNIVGIYDVGREGNLHYIVMELVEGKTLNDIIDGRPMDYRKVIELTKQIGAGISFAHKNNIIHRDIKPHNILVTADGVAKIADFGIAKAINESATIKESDDEMIMGSVHYFSPEQARGGYVDEKSDMYSLGIVMYEMLTGTVPFDGENPVTVALKHINETIVPPSQLVPGIPARLEKIVMKAVSKYQVDRYDNMDEMLAELDSLQLVSRVVGEDAIRKDNTVTPEDVAAYAAGGAVDGADEEDYEAADEGGSGGSSKKKKIIIAVAILVVLAIIGIAVKGLTGKADTPEDPTPTQTTTIEAPDFRGMSYEDAIALAQEKGVKVEKADEVFSDEYDKGIVASQNPVAGTELEKGDTVSLYISKGKGEAVVPNVLGKTKSEAESLLSEQGFSVGTITERESEEKKGTIIEQSPGAGESVSTETKIDLVISIGITKKTTSMPNVLGMDLDSAKSELRASNLKPGSVTYEYSDSYEEDAVMEQEYEEGTELDENTTVDLVVSKGNKEGSVDIYIDYGPAESEEFTLKVTVSDSGGTRTVIGSETRNRADGGETVNVTGQGAGTVKVYFGGVQIYTYEVDFNAETYN